MKKLLGVLGIAAAVGVFGLLVVFTSDVGAAPNNNVPVAPALPASVTAAPTNLVISTPWNCFAGDMAGSLCNINSELIMTVGFQDPNDNRQIARVYQIKLVSDGTTVSAFNITGGRNDAISWTPPVNSGTKFANLLDFLNLSVSRLKNQVPFAVRPSL